MAFALKRLAWHDMAAANEVLRASFDDRLPWLAGLHTAEEDRAFFQDRVFGACSVWGAVDGGLLGVTAFREGWVEQLYVLPRRQRQGAGAANAAPSREMTSACRRRCLSHPILLPAAMPPYLTLAVAIVAELIGTSAIKASQGFNRPLPSAIVLASYALSFYFLSLTVQKMPVGIVYAIWSGVGIVMISLIGWVWYAQKLDPAALAGITLIIAGVLVINLLSKTATH